MEATAKKVKLPWWRRWAKRLPKKIIPSRNDDQPYLIRYKLFGIPWLCAIFIHNFARGDDDVQLHDHPWPFWHCILEGHYYEEDKEGVHLRETGYSAFKRPRAAHRIILPDEQQGKVWTLVIRGPRLRTWGFLCKDGRWMPWKKHLEKRNDEDYEC